MPIEQPLQVVEKPSKHPLCKDFARSDLQPFLNYLSYLYHCDKNVNKQRFDNFKSNNVNISIYRDIATIAFISARFCKNNLDSAGRKRPDKLINLWQAVCGSKPQSNPDKSDLQKFLIPNEKKLKLINFPLKKGLTDAFDWTGKQRITTICKKKDNIEQNHEETKEMFKNLYGYAEEIGYDWKVIISECHQTKNGNRNFPYAVSQRNINAVIRELKKNAKQKKKDKKSKNKKKSSKK